MFKKTLCSLLAFLLLVLGGVLSANIIPEEVEAANTAAETCKNTYGGGDRQKPCEIGYNAGYRGDTLLEACGSVGQPVSGITYNGGTFSYCAGGHQFGSEQRVTDKVPAPTPTGETLSSRAIKACTEDFGKTGKRAEACQRGYKAAYAADATSAKVTAVCNKESSDQAKQDCRKGVDLADRDGVETKVPTKKKENDDKEGTPAKTEEDACNATGSPMSWIICPIIDMGSKFTDFVFNDIVRPFLEDVPISSNPDDPSYNAWKQFRLIGNIVLIGSLLAVVYAQARGDK